MPAFSPHKPNLVRLHDVEHVIRDGWIAQYRGNSFIGWWIAGATIGFHSHSAMLRQSGGRCDILQIREFQGGNAKTLASEVARNPGRIDIFSIDAKHFPEFNGRSAVEYMRELTGRDYGYWGVLRLALLRVPLVRRLWRFDADDAHDSGQKPFCSHAVTSACRIGGGVDPVPRTPDDLVSPWMLTQSLLYHYEFTLTP
jgi:hypothetical protein